jgi:RNA polymerase sigma factor (sigma-70 family)
VADEIEQLTAAMSRGDRRAVGAFYERYFGLLVRCARAALPRCRAADEQQCLDVVHDAVLRIVRTIRPVAGGEGQLIAWLRVVVQSAAYDRLRGEQRRAARERSAPPRPGPESHANGAGLAEQVAWLRGELARLDPRLVELIELRYEKQWTLAAIGARLGVSAGTVDGRLRRALGRMRERAREAFDDRP